jgi:hypothetical protein
MVYHDQLVLTVVALTKHNNIFARGLKLAREHGLGQEPTKPWQLHPLSLVPHGGSVSSNQQ